MCDISRLFLLLNKMRNIESNLLVYHCVLPLKTTQTQLEIYIYIYTYTCIIIGYSDQFGIAMFFLV